MRKLTIVFTTLIFLAAALFIWPPSIIGQAGRASQLAGIGLNGYIEQTDFDSLHIVTDGLWINDVQVTTTSAELNYNDISALGTGAVSKAVVLDGSGDYTWPGAGTLTHSGTLVYTTLNDGSDDLTSSAIELNYNDISALGTGAVSKAVVLDGSGDYTWPGAGTLTHSGTLVYTTLNDGTDDLTSTAAQLNAIPATTSSAAELNYVDIASVGTGVALKAVVLDSGEDYTWPSGGVLTYGVLHDGTTQLATTAAELNLLNTVVAGTRTNSKAIVVDGSGTIDALDITALSIGAVAVASTAAEIDRVADKTASVVNFSANATETVTLAAHGDRIMTLNRAAGITITLPAATGTGASYTFIVGTGCTSNDYIIEVADGTDVFDGGLAFGVDLDGEGATGFTWYAVAGDDTFTMPNAGPVSGGEVGDMIKVIDYATDAWYLEAHIQQGGGGEVTPFSSAVP